MLHRLSQPGSHPSGRRGFVLLAVLLVIVLLTLAAYQYSDAMLAEARATSRILKTTEAKALADSGVHYAAALLATPDAISSALGGNPYDTTVFQGVTVQQAGEGRRQGRFSLVAVDYSQSLTSGSYPKRFGVTDEAGKININALMQLDPSGKVAHDVLLQLPNMTEDIVNAILDWIDPDEEARTGGAETQYYSALSPPYQCKNGPLDSLEELLLVKGVTPDLLFGTDQNRNGDSDPGDGSGSGSFDAGWAPFLTVYSRENNVDSTGQPRINLNSQDLSTLYNQLQAAVGQDMAAFIVAYRIYSTGGGGSGGQPAPGPAPTDANKDSGGSSNMAGRSGSSGSGMSAGGAGQSNSTAARGTPAAVTPSASSGAAASGSLSALTTQVQNAVSNSSLRAQRSVPSIFGLINAKVTVPGQQGQPSVTYASPLSDQSKIRELLPLLLDKTTTQSQKQLPGRVNVNTASDIVLGCLPGLAASDVSLILGARPTLDSLGSADSIFQTAAWLVTEAGLKPETAQSLERYVTATTQVYRVQSLGYFDGGGPMVRVEAVIDTNGGNPRILYYRDLTELGRAFDSFLQQSGK